MTNAGNNNTPRLPEAAQYFKRDNVTTINIKRNKKERKKNKQITFTYSKQIFVLFSLAVLFSPFITVSSGKNKP